MSENKEIVAAVEKALTLCQRKFAVRDFFLIRDVILAELRPVIDKLETERDQLQQRAEQAESMLALNAQIEEQFVDGSPESMIAEICRLRHEIEQAQVCKMQNNLGGSAMTTPNTKQLAEEMAERCASAIAELDNPHRESTVAIILRVLNLEQLLADKAMLAEIAMLSDRLLTSCFADDYRSEDKSRLVELILKVKKANLEAAMNTKEGEKE